jgi:hypothetical protein
MQPERIVVQPQWIEEVHRKHHKRAVLPPSRHFRNQLWDSRVPEQESGRLWRPSGRCKGVEDRRPFWVLERLGWEDERKAGGERDIDDDVWVEAARGNMCQSGIGRCRDADCMW